MTLIRNLVTKTFWLTGPGNLEGLEELSLREVVNESLGAM
jgi:hypothetical protein